jgi:hypothetical protein
MYNVFDLFLSSLPFSVYEYLQRCFPNWFAKILYSHAVDIPGKEKYRELCAQGRIKLQCDSGAFSTNNTKQEEGFFESYDVHLEMNKHTFTQYFNYDEDFTEHGFYTNLSYQKHLEAQGHKPTPVIHNYTYKGYNHEVDYYLHHKNRYSQIALGSLVGPSGIFSRTKAHFQPLAYRFYENGVDAHLFANASYSDLWDVPVKSSDATSWAKDVQYNCMKYWNPDNPFRDKTETVYFDDYRGANNKNVVLFSNYSCRKELESYLENTLGITYDKLHYSPRKSFWRQVASCAYYIKLEEEVNKSHRLLGFIK